MPGVSVTTASFPPCGGRCPEGADGGCATKSRASVRLAPPPRPSSQGGGGISSAAATLPLLLLAACATQLPAAVDPAAPGFLLGLWHGFIFPFAFILSLFMAEVSVYAVPNNGVWYDVGYFIGIVFLGVGARKSRIVTRERVVVKEPRE